MPRKHPTLLVLVAVTMLNPLALNILQPALPDLTRHFETDYGFMQLTLALYLVASAIAQIWIGPVSDKIGRRPVALAGVAVFIVGAVACIAATSVGWLVAGRIVQAIGGVAGFVVARAVVRDLFERDEAASKLGYITMAMVVVPMVSPLIGGALSEIGGHIAIFLFSGAVGALVLVYAYFDLHETRERPEPGSDVSIGHAYTALLGSRPFLGHALTLGLTSATFFTFLAAAPYVVVELQQQSPAVYGLWWIFASGPFMLGNYLAGRLSQRYGVYILLRIGLIVPLIGLCLLAAGYSLWPERPAVLFLTTSIGWVGAGLTLPTASALALSVRPDLAGAASGLSGALHMGAGSITALIVSFLLADSAWPMIVTMFLTAILAILSHLAAGPQTPSR